MRVGAREGFASHSVKLVLPADRNKYEVDSSTFFFSFISGNALDTIEYCTVPTLTFF